MKRKLSAVLCALFIIIFALAVFADGGSSDAASSVADGIISYNLSSSGASDMQAWLDGELADGAGTGTEWYVLGLVKYAPALDFSAYADALERYVSDNTISSAVVRQRCALTLIACGRGEDAFVAATAEDSIGKLGVMSCIFGLHLLNNGCESSEYTPSQLVNTLLELRKTDGGWAVSGEYSDVDVTSMCLQALAAHYAEPDVKAAVDSALTLLSEKQLDGGDYQSYGAANPESACQVLLALSCLGIDCSDARFVKSGTLLDGIMKYRLSGGSFSHAEGGQTSGTATSQAFYSLVGQLCFSRGGSSFYIYAARAEETTDAPDTVSETSGVQTSPGTSDAQTEAARESGKSIFSGYKFWVCAGVLAAAALVCLQFRLAGKKNYKDYIFVVLLAAAVVLVVLLTNFSSASDYYSAGEEQTGSYIGKVSLTIRCDNALGEVTGDYIPSDGVILQKTEFGISEGESVFDVLVRAAKKYGIQMENTGSGTGLVYVSGINYLYEFECGELSGWLYRVNGKTPSVGCGEYTLRDGDEIEWFYTLTLGKDVGQ